MTYEPTDIPEITAIIPHMPGQDLSRLTTALESQSAKIILLPVTGGDSLTEDYNRGIAQVRTEFTLLVQADCVPVDRITVDRLMEWMAPNVVAVTSDVVLLPATYDCYSFWGKVLMNKFVGCTNQGISGKMDLVRTEALQAIGGYDSAHFPYSGDDVDLYLRLLPRGQIITSAAMVKHLHDSCSVTLSDVMRKRYHWGQSTGALFRKHGVGVLRAKYAQTPSHHTNKFITLSLPLLWLFPWLTPLLVILVYLLEPAFLNMPLSRNWLKLVPVVPLLYLCDLFGYVDGFFRGKQSLSVYK